MYEYMERYQNVAQYFGAYRLNGIVTNFEEFKIISTVCAKAKTDP